ncbi:multiheme c-type cytochrome [Heliorestis convoluta]|uniref:Cytochrome c-552/4 domain-containing protein n=1 Tax=Heliorestis convoluta TaxID=356322 RepID=A0A5Q2MZT8_9FIRM|nr:multiheme c-type cytochrome [Heliorestis convoluta]QGG48278.1 hypothetical protein FTV88_2180 [Heliorestis convoluta]
MNNKGKKIIVFAFIITAFALVLSACGIGSLASTTTIGKIDMGEVHGMPLAMKGKEGFVGPDECIVCHVNEHKNWEKSWHTQKAMWGPSFEDAYENDIYDWVLQEWDNLETYMILDKKDNNTNYVAVEKVQWQDVDFIIGKTYKQRYMTYYNGEPRQAYLQITEDGGISWTIDKSVVVEYEGNKERAGYKFLAIETKPKEGDLNKNNYGEFRSWQERCISCHTTGFDPDAWNEAKANFVAGEREDLRDIFVADIRVSCESCHGPGATHVNDPTINNIINPRTLTNVEQRLLVCQQCHTRTSENTMYGNGANDNRRFVLGEHTYEDVMNYVRPAWGTGNRNVSPDGKARRGHQQDMDIMLSQYIKGPRSNHARLSCAVAYTSQKVAQSNVNGK